MRNSSVEEFAVKCDGAKLIAIMGKCDDENTQYATKICKCLSNRTGKSIYFSLMYEKEILMKKFSDLPAEIDDTAGLEIGEMEIKIADFANRTDMNLIVVACLPLMSNQPSCEI